MSFYVPITKQIKLEVELTRLLHRVDTLRSQDVRFLGPQREALAFVVRELRKSIEESTEARP